MKTPDQMFALTTDERDAAEECVRAIEKAIERAAKRGEVTVPFKLAVLGKTPKIVRAVSNHLTDNGWMMSYDNNIVVIEEGHSVPQVSADAS